MKKSKNKIVIILDEALVFIAKKTTILLPTIALIFGFYISLYLMLFTENILREISPLLESMIIIPVLLSLVGSLIYDLISNRMLKKYNISILFVFLSYIINYFLSTNSSVLNNKEIISIVADIEYISWILLFFGIIFPSLKNIIKQIRTNKVSIVFLYIFNFSFIFLFAYISYCFNKQAISAIILLISFSMILKIILEILRFKPFLSIEKKQSLSFFDLFFVLVPTFLFARFGTAEINRLVNVINDKWFVSDLYLKDVLNVGFIFIFCLCTISVIICFFYFSNSGYYDNDYKLKNMVKLKSKKTKKLSDYRMIDFIELTEENKLEVYNALTVQSKKENKLFLKVFLKISNSEDFDLSQIKIDKSFLKKRLLELESLFLSRKIKQKMFEVIVEDLSKVEKEDILKEFKNKDLSDFNDLKFKLEKMKKIPESIDEIYKSRTKKTFKLKMFIKKIKYIEELFFLDKKLKDYQINEKIFLGIENNLYYFLDKNDKVEIVEL